MSHPFSTTALELMEKMTPGWRAAAEKFVEPNGSAEKDLGKIKSVEIKSREEGPVHRSNFNPEDKEDIISMRVEGENHTKTCHVHGDGTGTTGKGRRRG